MVKRCSYGTCNADSRYPDRLGNTQFHPFPKPARNLEKCIKWIRLCGRPHQQLSLDKLRNHSTAKHIYVCSKHFIDGRPTPAHPDPLPALTYDRSNVTPAKRPAELQTVSVPSRKRLRDDCHLDDAEDIRCDLQVVSVDIKEEMATEPIMEDTTTEESTTVPKIGMCFVSCHVDLSNCTGLVGKTRNLV
ncbi:UDP-N-acetylmuramoyl-L-alanyl-D-glutamate--2,6-diaminopimelate ligase [Labeo rohita]|uniref:UDP-N-acetylmuramoyl-L-alanyl-D-glutamate--2, 6-diaminopimelate ligase n=1 Tax=Labeo rohita TaxID=84645 RepID=A0ABQ8MAZ3_LABRO|nr:UDP-N-acetylmuramoyl-L-alanyl-D-glutamate--2,6-diaminopimelate ligase [Labeo rohita]